MKFPKKTLPTEHFPGPQPNVNFPFEERDLSIYLIEKKETEIIQKKEEIFTFIEPTPRIPIEPTTERDLPDFVITEEKELKTYNPIKQEYQPIRFVSSRTCSPLVSSFNLFDSVLSYQFISRCDIPTVGVLMRLNKKWYNMIQRHPIWEIETTKLKEYLEPIFADPPVLVGFGHKPLITNEHDKVIIMNVINGLNNTYAGLSKFYRTIRYIDEKKYMLVEPNPDNINDNNLDNLDPLSRFYRLPNDPLYF